MSSTSSCSLFDALEREYVQLYTGPNVAPTDDSDDERPLDETSNLLGMTHNTSPQSARMTIESTYCGKTIRFKGNQLILWARQMQEEVVQIKGSEPTISSAIASGRVTIRSSDDWLFYEGIFDNFAKILARPTRTFRGIATIIINRDASTTVEFKNKITKMRQPDGTWVEKEGTFLYAYLHDAALIDYLKKKAPKYAYPSNHGLSYRNIVEIIETLKTDFDESDASLADRQLTLFQGSTQGPVTIPDRFLSYFNAILFGSESSRNSLSFLTGILVLDLIAHKKLTYSQSFQTPDSSTILENGKRKREGNITYAVYPMASPYSGKNNFKAYKKLIDLSQKEAGEKKLSSAIGMKASRQRPGWTQIQIKEALLFKYWAQSFGGTPGWSNARRTKLGLDWSVEEHGHAIEFARRFNQNVVSTFHRYYPRTVPRLLVYSADEMHALGWFKLSYNVWKAPTDPHSTEVDYDALKWYITSAEPMRLEKDLDDVMYDLMYDAEGE